MAFLQGMLLLIFGCFCIAKNGFFFYWSSIRDTWWKRCAEKAIYLLLGLFDKRVTNASLGEWHNALTGLGRVECHNEAEWVVWFSFTMMITTITYELEIVVLTSSVMCILLHLAEVFARQASKFNSLESFRSLSYCALWITSMNIYNGWVLETKK